jgi:hypothetical protein
MAYSLAAAAAAIGLNKTQHPARQNGRGRAERTTITVHPRAMSSAPLDATKRQADHGDGAGQHAGHD